MEAMFYWKQIKGDIYIKLHKFRKITKIYKTLKKYGKL